MKTEELFNNIVSGNLAAYDHSIQDEMQARLSVVKDGKRIAVASSIFKEKEAPE